ncbi:MAG: hypothetical protein M3071_13970 [Actinomycetota bacterium]|nr:hypothetical protein [Actinomycetota bacterium]
MSQIRGANPIPHELPAPPIEEVWRRLDADGQGAQLGRESRVHRSLPAWLPSVGGVVATLSATAAVGIAVLAIVLLGHGRSLPTPSSATVSSSPALPLGPGIGPQTAANNSGPGAVLLSTVKVVVQTRDPLGGLPWGVREFQTTRGQTCLQTGRVQGGMIGVIGQDGAWGNDHRFHPISPNASIADNCSQTDGNGHAFENVMQAGESASGGAQLAELQSQGCGLVDPRRNPCPRADLRVLQYGLLGPDALSITYLGSHGRLLTEPAVGPDGGYLIVGPATKRLCRATWDGSGCGHAAPGGYAYGPALSSGLVTAVRYRDGHSCRVPAPPPWGSPAGTPQASCPVVGYRAPQANHETAAMLAAPVTARRLPRKPLVEIAFTARVAVTNANSYYEYTIASGAGAGAGATLNCSEVTGGSTFGTHVRAGQRVVLVDQIKANCTGVLRGTVAYVPNIGPGGFEYPGPAGQVPGNVRSIMVGRFGLAIR